MNKYLILTLGILFSIFAPEVFAQSNSPMGIDSMFANFKDVAKGITSLINDVAWVVGIGLTIYGIFKLAESSNNKNIGKNVAFSNIFAGIFLFNFSGTLFLAQQTINTQGAGAGSILMPMAGWSELTKSAMYGVFAFFAMVGAIAVFRGILILKEVGEGKGSGVSVGKGLTHIFGGAACLQIEWVARLTAETMKITLPF